MAEHNVTGIKGEIAAAEFLLQNGYSIIEKNWRFAKYEIDIIAEKDSIIVVAEVKTRTGNFVKEPFEAVTRKKQKFLVEAADKYLQINNIESEVRFDIISIIFNNDKFQINHIVDAFYPLI